MDDHSFDVAVNLESSHCYPNIRRFFAELTRVLRPGCVLLHADYRPKKSVGQFLRVAMDRGLKLKMYIDITDGVVEAMTNVDIDREKRTIVNVFSRTAEEARFHLEMCVWKKRFFDDYCGRTRKVHEWA